MISSFFTFIILSTAPQSTNCFTTNFNTRHVSRSIATTTSLLPAKKNKSKKKNTQGQGFGKQQKQSFAEEEEEIDSSSTASSINYTPLQSIETEKEESPFTSTSSKNNADGDESKYTTEERTKKILQEKFGLKSYEQRQDDIKSGTQEKKLAKLVKQAKKEEDIDFFKLIPAPLIIFLDGFLKIGLGVTILLFVGAGLGITLEAYSAATGNPLPENVDSYISNVIEPNFTIGLLVLLGFSVSLGVFSLAQLGSKGSVYRED